MNKIGKIFLFVMLFCGKVNALPQDWSCDEILIEKIREAKLDNSSYTVYYYGKNDNYSVEIEFPKMYSDELVTPNCGSAGCMGKMTDLKTSKTEEMRFDCTQMITDTIFSCHRIDGSEYILTHMKGDEYRVNLCHKFYRFLKIKECHKCTCILHNSSNAFTNANISLNCTRENEKQIHCFNHEAYSQWKNYQDNDKDFENCIGLSID